jgi:hypothetical protein
VLPGHHPQDHFRASQDLREVVKPDDDPAGSWVGEWDLLALQAMGAADTAVISHELFSAVDRHQADRALRSLAGAEVHLVVTVRDIATVLPAEWQESIKHRNRVSWPEWAASVTGGEADDPQRRNYWFWRVHDTAEILAIWSRHLPPDRVHVVTMPPAGAEIGLLWKRFAEVIGVAPDSVDISRADPNTSLGIPEIEFLRRLNHEMPDEVPDWFYMGSIKEGVAQRALTTLPRVGRLVLPGIHLPWATEYAEQLIDTLKRSAFDIVGDLHELRPRDDVRSEMNPGDQTPEQMLDAAMVTITALIVNQYRRMRPAVRPRSDFGGSAGLIGRVESAVAASPRLRRTVRDLSGRYPTVRRLRVLAWRSMERSRTQRDG